MVVYCHEMERHSEKLIYTPQDQGPSKGLQNKNYDCFSHML